MAEKMTALEYVSAGAYFLGFILVIIGLILWIVSFTTSNSNKAASLRIWGLCLLILGPIISIVACMKGGGKDCTSSVLNNLSFGYYRRPLTYWENAKCNSLSFDRDIQDKNCWISFFVPNPTKRFISLPFSNNINVGTLNTSNFSIILSLLSKMNLYIWISTSIFSNISKSFLQSSQKSELKNINILSLNGGV